MQFKKSPFQVLKIWEKPQRYALAASKLLEGYRGTMQNIINVMWQKERKEEAVKISDKQKI